MIVLLVCQFGAHQTCSLVTISMVSGLIKLQDLMRAPPDLEMEAYIRQASPSNFRDVLKEIKNKDIFNLVVDTNPENINQFLRAVGEDLCG